MLHLSGTLRATLTQLVSGPWTEFWIAAPRLAMDAVQVLLPHLNRPGARVRVLTELSAGRIAEGALELEALQALRELPACEFRGLPSLTACVYVAGPGGAALVTGASLALAELESAHSVGTVLEGPNGLVADLEEWWNAAQQWPERRWAGLVGDAARQIEGRSLGAELARVGAFVRVSVRGVRRSRRLDPRDFGAGAADWGRVVRPVEVALFKLDDVERAREDLVRILTENGVEWNGQYLVPRQFLERDWPRLFAAREQQLRERLSSSDGQAALKTQLKQAEKELEGFFAELWPRVDGQGLDAPTWIETQVHRVLAETVAETVLEESGLEYRVLTLIPEDDRSVEELGRLLRDPRLRSVQLTFPF